MGHLRVATKQKADPYDRRIDLIEKQAPIFSPIYPVFCLSMKIHGNVLRTFVLVTGPVMDPGPRAF